MLRTEARSASLQEDNMRMLRERITVLEMDDDGIGCEQSKLKPRRRA